MQELALLPRVSFSFAYRNIHVLLCNCWQDEAFPAFHAQQGSSCVVDADALHDQKNSTVRLVIQPRHENFRDPTVRGGTLFNIVRQTGIDWIIDDDV